MAAHLNKHSGIYGMPAAVRLLGSAFQRIDIIGQTLREALMSRADETLLLDTYST